MTKKREKKLKWTLEDELRLRELRHLTMSSSGNLEMLNDEYSRLIQKKINVNIPKQYYFKLYVKKTPEKIENRGLQNEKF